MTRKSGKFIVFEGSEGAGKTTQIQRLRQWIERGDWHRGKLADPPAAIATREPGGTPLGRELRQILLQCESVAPRTELLLYAADRAQHVNQLILPHLAAGDIVLCDRFTDSTIAYQGYGRGLDLKEIAIANQLATDGLESDLTLWLDLDVETGLARARKRGKTDKIEGIDVGFHQRVREGYRALAKERCDRTVRIDAGRDEETVAGEVRSVVRGWLERWYELE